MKTVDTIVVGGGLVGIAVAYGLARLGQTVEVMDEGDIAYRASRGNFGLVWFQGKGDGTPEYSRWTRGSTEVWPEFSERLRDETGVDVNYHKPGGVHLCLSEDALQSHAALIRRMHDVHGAANYGAKILNRQELDEILPGLGPDVIGGSWSPHDGHASPLYLLRALHSGFQKLGGTYHAGARVERIDRDEARFVVRTNSSSHYADKVVLAAGLGNRALGNMVGLNVPISPLKGQILVTERVKSTLSMPTTFVRQTEEGSFLLGDSHEDAGFDTTSKSAIMADIANRAIRTFPFLKDLRVVRSWAALRIMTDDGCPIYEQSVTHPGAFTVNCHSGVTLAGAHAMTLAPMIAQGRLEDRMSVFSAERFNV
ncbi:FAD-binding oxidoreductase [Thalassospira sp.]|uniref:NAD(P)/FAD-dependent oxidoreductase n=1 Tax=Thalassospira sp. TaxID=1912094 RepID=UPI0027328286|nr:FAD-dependent oxidoreductase [Thalassospira sp.]MDP2699776.1 FAD-dependent oxidoreductase [Thalassospira sp.]